MATACLLRTRLAFVGEVQNYYTQAKKALGDVPIASQPLQLQIHDEIPLADELSADDELDK